MLDGKYVILCVDDDPDVVEADKVLLESEGYVVTTASGAEEALDRYEETRPDVLLIDLMMEEVDAGTSLVKELKARGNTAPVYMLSSLGDALSDNIDYAELGLAGVFQKPLRAEVLLKTLNAKLGHAGGAKS